MFVANSARFWALTLAAFLRVALFYSAPKIRRKNPPIRLKTPGFFCAGVVVTVALCVTGVIG
jgi:hypothetical protein